MSFSRPPETRAVQQFPWISTLLFQCSVVKDVANAAKGIQIQDFLLNGFAFIIITALEWRVLSMHCCIRAENAFRSFEFLGSRAAVARVAVLCFYSIAFQSLTSAMNFLLYCPSLIVIFISRNEHLKRILLLKQKQIVWRDGLQPRIKNTCYNALLQKLSFSGLEPSCGYPQRGEQILEDF